MAKKKVSGPIPGQMEMFIMENGKIANNMDKVILLLKPVKITLEHGFKVKKMEKVFTLKPTITLT